VSVSTRSPRDQLATGAEGVCGEFNEPSVTVALLRVAAESTADERRDAREALQRLQRLTTPMARVDGLRASTSAEEPNY
jgi:hypothetical protein